VHCARTIGPVGGVSRERRGEAKPVMNSTKTQYGASFGFRVWRLRNSEPETRNSKLVLSRGHHGRPGLSNEPEPCATSVAWNPCGAGCGSMTGTLPPSARNLTSRIGVTLVCSQELMRSGLGTGRTRLALLSFRGGATQGGTRGFRGSIRSNVLLNDQIDRQTGQAQHQSEKVHRAKLQLANA
jgi:hypothetical protein